MEDDIAVGHEVKSSIAGCSAPEPYIHFLVGAGCPSVASTDETAERFERTHLAEQ